MRITEMLLSIDEYLDRHFEPEAELIAGELRPKPLGTDHHSDICGWLCALLAKAVGRACTRVELSIRIGDDVLIPDVCVLRAAEKILYRDILAEPPLLCVEVVSPSQRAAEMLAKCERYHEFGVAYCWVIEPVSGRAWENHAGKSPPQQNTKLSAGDLTVSLAELFGE